MKYLENAVVTEQNRLCDGIYSLYLQTENIAAEARPGQFVSVYCRDESRLLPRPVSICETDGNILRLVYRVSGAGTEEFSKLGKNDTLKILGPLGCGFPLDKGYEKVFIAGGGIGLAPLVKLTEELPGEKQIIAGYRGPDLFLTEEFSREGRLYIATEDGSAGTKGTVLDAIRENSLKADAVFACGPKPMLKSLKEYAARTGMDCYISLEERMACGVGACLSCVCGSKDTDEHSRVENKRVCCDGPVFAAEDVEL